MKIKIVRNKIKLKNIKIVSKILIFFKDLKFKLFTFNRRVIGCNHRKLSTNSSNPSNNPS
jgi:hypothetical protein